MLAQSHLRNRDPEGGKMTPLFVALNMNSNIDIVQLLISAGADVNAVKT
jgi:hypothetical protein